MLVDKIQKDLREAIKKREKERISALRMVTSELRNKEIARKEPLDDETAMQVIQKQVNKHQDSISQFSQAGRTDLADKERAQMGVLKEYLPEPMSKEEVKEIVDNAVEELDAAGLKDLGRVMGNVMPKVRGRFDGAKVNKIAREKLGWQN